MARSKTSKGRFRIILLIIAVLLLSNSISVDYFLLLSFSKISSIWINCSNGTKDNSPSGVDKLEIACGIG